MTTDTQARYLSFEDFRLDCRSGELRRNRREIKLQPQPAKLLVLLATRPGEVVTRAEIQNALWGDDTFVDFEHGINFSIKQIRDALGDNAEKPRYIETVPRVGYRFVALAESLAPDKREPERSPYPGLNSFSSSDSAFFFGREGEVESVRRKLESRQMLALIGPSGAGKSSFLRAGLVPSLPEGVRSVFFIPGSAPMRALARALVSELSGDTEAMKDLMEDVVAAAARWRKRCEQALVVIDAFEELFTLNPPEVQREFAETLGRLSVEADVHVLLSMRDDFLFRCHDYEVLARVFLDLTPLGPLKGPALRRALVEPALSCGYRFETEELVEEMLREVEGERGALPLLAFAASRLWEKRDLEKRLVTREAYQEIGGVGGALAKHAEETLQRIGTERTPLVRELFRNLVTAQGTRASREVSELLSIFAKSEERRAAEEVLRELVAARLLTAYETSVEIIHESLLSAWPRLVRWQAQDTEGALLRDQLRQTAQVWQERGRPDDLLWTGSSYREFSLWRERYPGGLSATEEAFADAATRLAGRRRGRRRIGLASVFVVMLAVIAVVLASRQQAVNAALRAEASKLLALGQVELDTFPTAALAYALKSLELTDTREARLFALRALSRGPTATLTPEENEAEDVGAITSPAFSPNGEWLALGGWQRVEVFHRDGRAPFRLGDYPRGNKGVWTGFGPGSDQLVAFRRGDVRVWSLPEGREVRRARFEEGPADFFVDQDGFVAVTTMGPRQLLRFLPFDGGESRVIGTMDTVPEGFGNEDVAHGSITYRQGGKIYIRSLEDWASPPRLIAEHSANVRSVALSPDGRRLAASDGSGQIRIWSTMAPADRPLRVLRGKDTGYVRFDPTGTKLAGIAGEGGQALFLVWDLNAPPDAEPLALRRSDYYAQYGNYLTFEPSGGWLATAQGGDAALWRLDGSHPHVLRVEGRLREVAFTNDGGELVSAGFDAVRAWPLSVENGAESRVLLRGGLWWPSMVLDSESGNVVVGAGNGRLVVVPLSGGPVREMEPLHPPEGSDVIALGDGGRLVATIAIAGPLEDRIVKLVDLETGAVRAFPWKSDQLAETEYVECVQFLGSDKLLLSVAGRGLFLFDLKDGTSRVLSPQPRFQFVVNRDVSFGLGVTGNPDEGIRPTELVRFTLDGSPPRILPSHGVLVNDVALDPTETLVATGSTDGTVRIGPISGDEPHILFGHEGIVITVAFSPDGRWLASGGMDKTVRLWPVPDVTKPPLHTLPYQDLLRDLRSRTNLRVVPDASFPTGWKLDREPFPGWESVRDPES